MQQDFWLERWAESEIGFHQKSFNRLLTQFWETLEIPKGTNVFVPLCGKSRDMLWIGNAGYRVIGTELSEIAVQSFFFENRMCVNAVSEPPFKIYEYDSYKLLVGDHFALTKEQLPKLSAVYDRAALIALPEPMRTDYVDHLRLILPSGCVMLLISLEYDQNLVSPPPFDIYQEEIRQRFSPWCEIKQLATISATIKGQKGFETAYRITVR